MIESVLRHLPYLTRNLENDFRVESHCVLPRLYMVRTTRNWALPLIMRA
jgi:hypothetical protein